MTLESASSVILRPIQVESIGTLRLVKCALASIYNNPWRLFGRNGVVMALSSSLFEDITAAQAKHGAIVFHDVYLDYSSGGLEICTDKQTLEVNVGRYTESYDVQSSKSREELIQWVYSESIQSKFTSDKYKTGTNNCIHFVHDCCQFLEVEVPDAVKEIMDKLKRYGSLLDGEVIASFSSVPALPIGS